MAAQAVVAFTAACPACGVDAYWQVEAVSAGDLSRTSMAYQISCACDRPAPKPLAAALDLSRAAWLRRSA